LIFGNDFIGSTWWTACWASWHSSRRYLSGFPKNLSRPRLLKGRSVITARKLLPSLPTGEFYRPAWWKRCSTLPTAAVETFLPRYLTENTKIFHTGYRRIVHRPDTGSGPDQAYHGASLRPARPRADHYLRSGAGGNRHRYAGLHCELVRADRAGGVIRARFGDRDSLDISAGGGPVKKLLPAAARWAYFQPSWISDNL